MRPIPQSRLPALPAPEVGGIFAPEILSELSIRLARLPREISKRSSRRASVIIPLCHDRGEPSLLFTKRAVSMRSHPGEVCFPGGMVQASDKNIVDAGLREMHEEIGIDTGNVEVLGVLRLHWDDLISITGVAVTPIVAFLGKFEELAININADEVKSCFCIPVLDIADRSQWEFAQTPGRTPVFRPGADMIWGLTAALLERFMVLLPSVIDKRSTIEP